MIDTTIFKEKTVAFFTLGCKLNFSETSTIGRSLMSEGFKKVDFEEKADVYIINTCSVTEVADKKCKQAIKKCIKNNPNGFVVVTGCFAQLKPETIVQIKGVDLVLGANEKFKISEFLGNLEKKQTGEVHSANIKAAEQFYPSYSFGDRTRSFLKVQDGCDYFCSYCTIPLARGKSRNASISKTIEQAQKAIEQGAKEIILTGVNIGDFGKSTNENFFDLVKALDTETSIERIRISSIEPNLLTDEIIEFVAQSNRFMPHFHIPLQSGSDKVLNLMKRRYSTQLFAQRVKKIKSVLPDAFIGVDVIVGVRGETEQDFADTLNFIETLDVSQLHVFPYSERPNTRALNIATTVPVEERKRRSKILHHLSEKKTLQFYTAFEDKEVKVLFEASNQNGHIHGYTENYLKIAVPFNKDLINNVHTIKTNKLNSEIKALEGNLIK